MSVNRDIGPRKSKFTWTEIKTSENKETHGPSGTPEKRTVPFDSARQDESNGMGLIKT